MQVPHTLGGVLHLRSEEDTPIPIPPGEDPPFAHRGTTRQAGGWARRSGARTGAG